MAAELANAMAHLRSLGPDVNPYVAFGAWLQECAVPRTEPSFGTHVRVNIGLMSCLLALSLITLAIKLSQSGAVWLVRSRNTDSGRLIVPNTGLLYLVVVIAYLAASLAFANAIYATYFSGGSFTTSLHLAGPTWLLATLAFYLQAYEIVLATFTRYSLRFRHMRAWHVNLVSLALPTVFVPTILSTSMIAVGRLSRGLDNLHSIQSTLAAVVWTPGQPFELNLQWTTQLLDIQTEIDRFLRYEQVNFALIMSFNVLVACAFVPASAIQLRLLRSHLRSRVQTSSSGHRGVETDRTVAALIGETVAIVCASLIYTGFTAWLTVTLKTAMSDAHLLNIAYSLGFYTYSICGWPCHLLLLHRTLAPLLRRRRHRQIAQGVAITIETVQHVDSHEDKPQPASHLDFAVLALRQEARDAQRGYAHQHVVHLPSLGQDVDLARLDKLDEKA